jgi:hypothetical protein
MRPERVAGSNLDRNGAVWRRRQIMRGFKSGKPRARVRIAALSAVCTAAAVIALSGGASAGGAKATHSQRGSIPAAKYLKVSKSRIVQARRSPTTPPPTASGGVAFTG